MSIRVTSQVWDHADAKGSELLLLLALADAANDEGVCWPSVATLAHKARLSKRQVQYALSALQARGLVRVYAHYEGKMQRSNRYQLVLQGVQPIAPGGRNPLHPGGAVDFTRGVQPIAYRTVIEPSLNRDGEPGAQNVQRTSINPFADLEVQGRKNKRGAK